MAKQIFLKEWVKPMAELHAISVVEDELGLTDPESSEYQREFEKAFSEFCEEFYSHSLVPMALNPTIIKGINAFVAFRNDLFDGETSWIRKNFKDKQQADENARQLKRAIGTIMRIYLQGNYSKMKFSYTPRKPEFEMTKDERKDDNRKVEVNRFVRLFIVSLVLGNVTMIYNMDAQKLYNTLFDLLRPFTSGDLRRKNFNVNFASEVKMFVSKIMSRDIITDFVKFGPKLDV